MKKKDVVEVVVVVEEKEKKVEKKSKNQSFGNTIYSKKINKLETNKINE